MRILEDAFRRLVEQSAARRAAAEPAGEIRPVVYQQTVEAEANPSVQAVTFTEEIDLDSLDRKTEDRLRRSVRPLE